MKKLIVLLLSGLMVLSMAACGSGSTASSSPASGGGQSAGNAADGQKYTFGVVIFDFANDYMYHVRSGMRLAGQENINFEIVDSQNDQSKQNDQIDTLIQKGVDAMMVCPVDSAASPTIMQKCKAADIPVVFVNRKPTQDIWEQMIADYDKCWYVGAATQQPGEIEAQMILEDWNNHPEWDKNGDGVLQYLYIKGEHGHVNAEARLVGSNLVFDEASFKREELELQEGKHNAAIAKDLMETWIGKWGDEFEMVISGNDSMALGAIEALKGEGYFTGDKYVPVYGVNAIPEALDELEKGTLAGTVFTDMLAEGATQQQIAYNFLEGVDINTDISFIMDEYRCFAILGAPCRLEDVPKVRALYESEKTLS